MTEGEMLEAIQHIYIVMEAMDQVLPAWQGLLDRVDIEEVLQYLENHVPDDKTIDVERANAQIRLMSDTLTMLCEAECLDA